MPDASHLHGEEIRLGGGSGVISKRLTKTAVGVAIVIAVMISMTVIQRIRAHDHKLSLGHDLLPSYAAGELVRTGHAREMYDVPTVQAIQARIVREANL